MKFIFFTLLLINSYHLFASEPKAIAPNAVEKLQALENNKGKLITIALVLKDANKEQGLILGEAIIRGVPLLGATDDKEVQKLRDQALWERLAYYQQKNK